jgi:predicted phage terminase large subunit-like protein
MKIINHEAVHQINQSYIKLLRSDYLSYLQKVFYTLNPNTKFIDNWHLQAIAEYLQAMQNGEIKRLIINIPPRSLKSIAITVGWSGFLLGHNPSCKIITASYSNNISLKHATDVRNLINMSWHKAAFPALKIMAGQNEKHKFLTTKQGFRLSTSIGGSLTGEGGDVIIVDDPQNPMWAASNLMRSKANEWFDKTLMSRLNDKKQGLILVVMQRLHPDDLSGHLLERGGFEHLILPAIAEGKLHIKIGNLDKIMQTGELLQPEREDMNVLSELRLNLGEAAFQAQYQQAPINEAGNMIKREWLKFGEIGEHAMIIQSWDTAIKTGASNDRSSCITIAHDNNNYYILDAVAIRADFPTLKCEIINQADRWQPQAILIEDKASGGSMLQELRQTTNLALIAINPKGDKVQRLARISPLFEAGRIIMPSKAIWLQELEAELLGFPTSKHDDMVDSLTQGIEWLRHNQAIQQHSLRFL